jgi:nitroimidazol reductase NimA-like FMN-containing flavoprotein (pyridoxamine 5'-phosphate oxidase superfamily)
VRRTDKEITDKMEISEIIKKCRVCRLAMSQDNIPYIVPVSFGYNENTIYFHSAVKGKKIDMLAANNHVCFEFECEVAVKPGETAPCDWSFSFKSVIGFGDVEELSRDEDKRIGLKRIMAQYSDKHWNFETVPLSGLKVFKIAIKSMTAKQSPPPHPA